MRRTATATTAAASSRVRARRMKGKTLPSAFEHTVDDQRVEVHVQVQRAPEPLNHHHRSAAPVGHAGAPGTGPQEAKDRPDIHPRHRPAQLVVPRQQVPQPMREAQDPLTHGDIGQYVIDQVRRALRHPSTAATGTEAAALARERHEAIVSAAVAVEARESRGETVNQVEFEGPRRQALHFPPR